MVKTYRNYEDAIAGGCRKVAVRLKEPQHYWIDRQGNRIPSYPADAIHDVAIILEYPCGRKLGINSNCATFVFYDDEIVEE